MPMQACAADEMDLVVHIRQDIADLLPQFQRNRRRELIRLRAALAAHNFGTLAFLGERMYALGDPYGFHEVSRLGRAIRDAALHRDDATLAELVALYEHYLACVQVVLVEGPAGGS